LLTICHIDRETFIAAFKKACSASSSANYAWDTPSPIVPTASLVAGQKASPLTELAASSPSELAAASPTKLAASSPTELAASFPAELASPLPIRPAR
jgi:hypothetical protein